MREKGIERKVDELGRVVIPIEMRRALGLEEGTAVRFDFYSDRRAIVLSNAILGCRVCGQAEGTTDSAGHPTLLYERWQLCVDCVSDIAADAFVIGKSRGS